MPARLRKDGLWESRKQVTDRVAGRVRLSGYGHTPEEADAELELRMIALNPPLGTPSTTLRDYALNSYLPTVMMHSRVWQEQVAWAIDKHIVPSLGAIPLDSLDRQMLQTYFMRLLTVKQPVTSGHKGSPKPLS